MGMKFLWRGRDFNSRPRIKRLFFIISFHIDIWSDVAVISFDVDRFPIRYRKVLRANIMNDVSW